LKVLFTADIHIKIGQKNVPVQWARNRYFELFADLQSLQHKTKADVFIIGGDIFDKVPSVEEMELFFELVHLCDIPTIIYSGNHEAVKKTTTFLSNLKRSVGWINPNVTIIDDYFTYKDEIDFIPYNKLKEYHPTDIDFHSRILCTHVRGEIPPHVKPEVNLDLFDRWDVVLAGDLHSYENSQRNILYPGSPVTTSFHRSRVTTGAIILDTDTLAHTFCELELPQLIKKTLKAGEEPVATEYDHTIYDIEGDMSELSIVADNDLIDKKIARKDKDTALILDAEMTMREELAEYLRYILMINEDTIEGILDKFSDHAKDLDSI
jgi:DNA repair exonuclease SbcCD nuclease subunit